MADTVEREIAGLTVVIDRELCIGSAACLKVAPQMLELDDEGIVGFTEDADDLDLDQEQVLEACQVCPVDALTVYDDGGEQLVP